jgi:hypothetical protein
VALRQMAFGHHDGARSLIDLSAERIGATTSDKPVYIVYPHAEIGSVF